MTYSKTSKVRLKNRLLIPKNDKLAASEKKDLLKNANKTYSAE